MKLARFKPLLLIAALFLICYYLPVGSERFDHAWLSALALVKWYAREHVVLCLLPAFFIAGAIAVFVSQTAVMKYLGANAPKALAYAVASVSGTILAVCSCTVLPLFAGIYRMGAGLGPATAFLYSGPAINVLAIVFTMRVLGFKLGLARAIGAILFSVIIGLAMNFIFRKEELQRIQTAPPTPAQASRPLWQTALYFATMVATLVFANWGRPAETAGLWYQIHHIKWIITALTAAAFALTLILWFKVPLWQIILAILAVIAPALLIPDNPTIAFAIGILSLSLITANGTPENSSWFDSTWQFARQILPLLFAGVFVAGLLLGSPDQGDSAGLIPNHYIAQWVGGNSLAANFFASLAGALMYFATLTEVPILQGLIAHGMGQGPALALLLAGPALSLPNMLVIRTVLGTKKTIVYVTLVVTMATITGLIYGNLFP